MYSDSDNFHVIHYSCETFYGDALDTSRRVTSISVLNVGSQQQTAFSVHLSAEQLKAATKKPKLNPDDSVSDHYNLIEKEMLKDFYSYVSSHPNARWLHWNMTNTGYGFLAIEQRYKALGGEPVQIPSSHLYNLADALVSIYGKNYIGHRRLYNLIALNKVTDLDMLSGEEEARAFESKEYLKLHSSTLRKVQAIYMLAELEQDGKLQTEASWWASHGATVSGVIDDWTASWYFRGAALVLIPIGLIQFVASLF